MKILPSQISTPTTDATEDFGASDKRFANMYAVMFNGTATAAQYADLAERYHSDRHYEPGTVLVIGGEFEVTISTTALSRRVIGVVSTAPAYMMNAAAGDNATHPFVALRGRVPCRVTGSIRKGDLLVTSSVPGHACSMSDEVPAMAVVGRALEDHEGGTGVIEIVV